MTTARSVINRALRQLGVVDPEETPTATQSANALEALNAMVSGWAGQKVDIGHENWALGDDVTLELDPKHVNTLVALLCIDLSAEYPGSVVPPSVALIASNGFAALSASYLDSSIDSDLQVDEALLPRRWSWR